MNGYTTIPTEFFELVQGSPDLVLRFFALNVAERTLIRLSDEFSEDYEKSDDMPNYYETFSGVLSEMYDAMTSGGLQRQKVKLEETFDTIDELLFLYPPARQCYSGKYEYSDLARLIFVPIDPIHRNTFALKIFKTLSYYDLQPREEDVDWLTNRLRFLIEFFVFAGERGFMLLREGAIDIPHEVEIDANNARRRNPSERKTFETLEELGEADLRREPLLISQKGRKFENIDDVPIAWFSCGAASYIATKIALEENPDLYVIYIDPGWEHPDNIRFLNDVEDALGIEITILKNAEYANPAEIFRSRKYIKSPFGAPCTQVLKKAVRQRFESALELQYFGFHKGEEKRAERLLMSNLEQAHLFRFPLIDHGYSKIDCLRELEADGIAIPVMYNLGFKNANCLGCVKGGKGYWKLVKETFPFRFEEMADLEEELGYTLFKNKDGEGVPLREVDWDKVKIEGGLSWDCGVLCTMEQMDLFDPVPEKKGKKRR